jgi:mRNA-degrading endonuclease RelE of RelBE toxin-antitoxin system
MNQIRYKTKAIRQIKKIKDKAVKAEIVDKINQLEFYPDTPFRVSRYKTTQLLKFRVKSWRVFFTAELEIIEIQEVKKRNEHTYK